MNLFSKKLIKLGIITSVCSMISVPSQAKYIIDTQKGNGLTMPPATYYFLGQAVHTTWQNTAGNWTDGTPGTGSGSETVTVPNIVQSIGSQIPGLRNRLNAVTKVTALPLTTQVLYGASTQSKELQELTVNTLGKRAAGLITDSGTEALKSYLQNYESVQPYPHTSIKISNVLYDSSQDKLSYKLTYPLKTKPSIYGHLIHQKFRQDIKNGISLSTAKDNALARFEQYAGKQSASAAEEFKGTSAGTGLNVLYHNSNTAATAYFIPILYKFETMPLKIDLRLGGPVCAADKESLVLEVGNAPKGWEGKEGYITVVDEDSWELKEYVEIKDGKAKLVVCVPKGRPRITMCYIPDPKNPSEKYCQSFTEEPNDMAVTGITLEKDGKPMAYPVPNQDNTVKIEVGNLGDSIIGNSTVDVTIVDKDNKQILGGSVATDKILPGKGKVIITVPNVKPSNNQIQVCAVINKKHTTNKENIQNANDKLCKSFGAVQDMGISQDVILKNIKGEVVNSFTPGELHTVVFKPKHVIGPQSVGLDPISNPMTTIDVTVKNAQGTVFRTETLTTTEVLEPSKLIEIPVYDVQSSTNSITVCATLNKKHIDKGYNLDNGNDSVCKTFSTTKNYAIKNLTVTPKTVTSQSTSVYQPLTFTYTLANEAGGSLKDAPLVVLKQNGREIWRKNVSLSRGEVLTSTIQVVANLSGTTTFEIEVNPNRTEVEFRANGAAPYGDNKKTTTVSVTADSECEGCEVGTTTSNSWIEKLTFEKSVANTKTYDCDHYDSKGKWESSHEVSYCPTATKEIKTVDKSYSESYKIIKIEARSKWSKDNASNSKFQHIQSDGWANVTNGGTFKVKAGYPVEIRVTTKYTTTRNSMPTTPVFSIGSCYNSTVEALNKPTPVNVPLSTSIKLPNSTTYTQLEGDVKGDWNDATATRELPERTKLSNTGKIRGVYISKNTKPGTYPVSVVTNVSSGYGPSNVVSGTIKKLQSCASFNIEVLINDDLGSHIVD